MPRYRWTWGVISKIPFSDHHYFFGDWDNDARLCDLKVAVASEPSFFKTPHGYHCVATAPISFRVLINAIDQAGCCRDFLHYTRRRGYATLEFQSPEESFFWQDKACFFAHFQRVQR